MVKSGIPVPSLAPNWRDFCLHLASSAQCSFPGSFQPPCADLGGKRPRIRLTVTASPGNFAPRRAFVLFVVLFVPQLLKNPRRGFRSPSPFASPHHTPGNRNPTARRTAAGCGRCGWRGVGTRRARCAKLPPIAARANASPCPARPAEQGECSTMLAMCELLRGCGSMETTWR